MKLLGRPNFSGIFHPMTVLILDNYDSFTYNLYQMVQAQTDQPVMVYRTRP